MPELPEVETVRRTLKNFVLDKEIQEISVHYDKIVEGDTKQFIKLLKGQKIQDIDRIGKYLIFKLDHNAFISHLRMEGKYNIVSSDIPVNKHEHITFHFKDGSELRYQDTRKFGRLELTDIENYATNLPLSKLGPEPMDALLEQVYPKLHKSNLPIKTLLLDQTIMAGIGNIYANEICFAMRINPYTPGKKLTKKRVQECIEVSAAILKKAIEQGGTTIHSFDSNGIHGLFQVQLQVHMQKICSICGSEISKEKINGRGTYYCKKCQRRKT
ncbi:MAG: DNA-formamidopyrimidine glycosylase [Coprobacillaceae bacterium]